jgi:formylglycine-generating enzyme
LKTRAFTRFARLTVLAVGGCNAILGIDEHSLADGSAGETSAGDSATGGGPSGSGGRGGSASRGPGGEGGDSGEALGGAAGHEQGRSGEGGSSDVGGGAAGGEPPASGEGGATGATGGSAGATGGRAEGGSSTGGAQAECSPGQTRCVEGGLQSCNSPLWGSTVSCDYCSKGACVVPPSCEGSGRGVSECGPKDEFCCNSSYVPGTTSDETFYRSYDGVTPGHTAMKAPASVSGFVLDHYEVTVGRFRRFVEAMQSSEGFPEDGAGRHEHVAGGAVLDGAENRSEHGWRAAWNQYLKLSLSETEPESELGVDCGNNQTWTPDPGANEDKPIVCANWFEAYAFCIWDGGFLPTETEWNYAAAGGVLQRVYPWSAPGSSAIECELQAHFGQSNGCSAGEERPAAVGSYDAGVSRWGQFDLAGNVWEWTLDTDRGYETPCADCAAISDDASAPRVLRGGSFYNPASLLLTAHRNPWPSDPEFTLLHEGDDDFGLQSERGYDHGFRCARSPLP